MTSLPLDWTGNWIDELGRTITIHISADQQYSVSVVDKNGSPFDIDTSGFNSDKQKTTHMKSEWVTDTDGQPHLQVEAGMIGLGPTYRLYFVVVDDPDQPRLASQHDPVTSVRIRPNIGMGLYDDWEDDLGVPWALPLLVYQKV